MRKIISLVFCVLLSAISSAQMEYLVGTANVSIDPENEIFSLALAGYGKPREGRFSIEWIKKDSLQLMPKVATANKESAFLVDHENSLFIGKKKSTHFDWQKVENIGFSLKHFAADDTFLYGIEERSSWVVRREIDKKNAKWIRLVKSPDIQKLASLDNHLFGIDGKQQVWKFEFNSKKWKRLKSPQKEVYSLTAYKHQLYAVGEKDTLWRIKIYEDKTDWIQIGGFNGITYPIHPTEIFVFGDRLYALTEENNIFRARNSSEKNIETSAITIRKNEKTVVVIGTDLTGFDYSFISDVKEEIFQIYRIPGDAVLINAAHNHFAPVTQTWITWQDFYHYPDSNYLKIVKRSILEAVKLSLINMEPCNLFFGRGETGIGMNRRAVDPELPVDKTLDVLEIRNGQDELKHLMFLTGVHVVFENSGKESFTIDANFPGVARDYIKKNFDVESTFIQGCAGDINPRNLNHTETGKELAEDVSQILKNEQQQIFGDISFSLDSFYIPVKPWSIEKIKKFKEEKKKISENVYAEKDVRWADLMLRRYESGKVSDNLTEYVQIIDIGDFRLVGLSREVVTEYGPAVRALWLEKMVSVAGYSNDVSSYLPKEWHIIMQTYEGHESFFWYGQPGLPPVDIFDIVLKNVNEIGNKK